MTVSSLRSLLRDRTSHLHRDLDAQVGMFATAADYLRYLTGTWRFRAQIEAALPGHAGWQPMRLADSVRDDLADLGEPVPPAKAASWAPANAAEMLGACYVLEGSAVGARMLVVAAEKLGFTGAFGARHLHLQAADRRRWPQFIDLLDASPAGDTQSALAGAEAAFRLALSSYLVPARV